MTQVLAVVGAGAAALVGVAAAGALIVRAERRGRRIVTGLLGDDRRPGALGRLDAVETAVVAIQAQMEPDHGHSMHDLVVRIDERTERTQRRLDEHLSTPHPRH